MVNIRDITITTPTPTPTTPANTGAGLNLLTGGFAFVNVERVRVTGVFRYGIVLDQAEVSRVRDSVIDNYGKNNTNAATVSSITRSGSTTTVTTSANHGYSVGDQVVVLGATQTEYNGIQTVLSVPSATTFTYTVTGTPATPATGTITTNLSINVWLTNGDEHTPQVTKSVTSLTRVSGIATAVTSAPHGWTEGQVVVVNGATLGSITSLTQSNNVATATTSVAHGYVVGDVVMIAGANQPEYNGTVSVQSVTTTTFTYNISGNPASPATGTITHDTFNGSKSISFVKQNVASITRSGSTATVTLNSHGYSNGDTIVIAGATQWQYNGAFVIGNVTTNTFTYTVAIAPAAPATPATGTITAAHGSKFTYVAGGSPAATGTINATVVMYAGFTNVIQVHGCQFNNGTFGVADDGGDQHSFSDNNFNGNAIGFRVAGASSLTLKGNTFENGGVSFGGTANILFTNTSVRAGGTESVTSITRSGSTATATASVNHGYKVGDMVIITGAGQTEYNGLQTITAKSCTTFDFTVSGTPASPATGTITANGFLNKGGCQGFTINDNTLSAAMIALSSSMLTFTANSSSVWHEGGAIHANRFDNQLGRSAAINVTQLRRSFVGPNYDSHPGGIFYTGVHNDTNGNILFPPVSTVTDSTFAGGAFTFGSTMLPVVFSGKVLFGAPGSMVGAADGEAVLANAKALRASNYVATATLPLIGLSSGDVLQLGGGYAGSVYTSILADFIASMPAGGAAMNGVIVIDKTGNRLVYYVGGSRYYMPAGTSF